MHSCFSYSGNSQIIFATQSKCLVFRSGLQIPDLTILLVRCLRFGARNKSSNNRFCFICCSCSCCSWCWCFLCDWVLFSFPSFPSFQPLKNTSFVSTNQILTMVNLNPVSFLYFYFFQLERKWFIHSYFNKNCLKQV